MCLLNNNNKSFYIREIAWEEWEMEGGVSGKGCIAEPTLCPTTFHLKLSLFSFLQREEKK